MAYYLQSGNCRLRPRPLLNVIAQCLGVQKVDIKLVIPLSQSHGEMLSCPGRDLRRGRAAHMCLITSDIYVSPRTPGRPDGRPGRPHHQRTKHAPLHAPRAARLACRHGASRVRGRGPGRLRLGSRVWQGRVRARLPPKNGFDTPPKYVFSPFSLYLQCILSAIHPLYLRHSDVLYRCVFSRYVVRYRSGIGLHAWCLHVLSIQYMRLYRRFSILNDTHRYMTSLSPLPRGCCACVSIQEAPSCPLV